MQTGKRNKCIDTEVLVLGSGAAGCGASLAVKRNGADVLLVDKGKIESSGCLGGGNDHFMAVLNSGPETDSTEALVSFYQSPLNGFTPRMIREGWANIMPIILDVLQEVGVIFLRNEDGSWLRTVGFGQPGPWFMNIENGQYVKRLLARKIRGMDIKVMDHTIVTRLLKTDGRVVGCVGFNVLDGTFHAIRAKTVVMAMGNTASRGWTNSTNNPYNIWQYPYNTGSYFVLAYDAGAKLINLDIGQRATMIPKGFGAPGMNGINGIGGYELNALGERFMGKYDPKWENGLRINQIAGSYQELIEGKGPPFFMDMRHLDKRVVHHLQHVLMPGDKATYMDYCEQQNIDFNRDLLEVEIGELCFSGGLLVREDFQTTVEGLYNGCVFPSFSGAICGGYYAGLRALEGAKQVDKLANVDEIEVAEHKEMLFEPLTRQKGISYKEIEGSLRQVMNYYMGYKRNRRGMEIAMDKLAFIGSFLSRVAASDYRELMRVTESAELIKMCRMTTRASMERKESGRAFYRRSDYPELDPKLKDLLVMWKENNEPKFSWGFTEKAR